VKREGRGCGDGRSGVWRWRSSWRWRGGSWLLAGTSDVAVKVFQFRPGRLDVKLGSSVTWVNQDDIDHTVTSGTPESPGGRFDATLSGKGSTTKRTTTR